MKTDRLSQKTLNTIRLILNDKENLQMKPPARNDRETVLDNEIIRKIGGNADPLSYDA